MQEAYDIVKLPVLVHVNSHNDWVAVKGSCQDASVKDTVLTLSSRQSSSRYSVLVIGL